MELKQWDFKDPTNPAFYVQRGYVPGMPLYWEDDITGTLPAAVRAYFEGTMTDDQVALVIAYIQHHIHAPCWIDTSLFGDLDEEIATQIRTLQQQSLTLKTATDINLYIQAALALALDPL